MTIPRKSYTEESVFQDELSALLASRFFIGTDWDYCSQGSYYSFILGERYALTCRKSEKGVGAFNNVCLHRNCLIDPPGQGRRRFRCGYHGWQYGDEGRLYRAPGFEIEAIACKQLTHYATADSKGLNFLGFESAPEISEVSTLVDKLRLEFIEPAFYTAEIEHQCNWKLLVENVLDREHLSHVHANSFASTGINSAAPVFAGGGNYTLWSRIQPEESAVSLGLKHFKGAGHHYLHGYVFPNLFLANTNNLIGFVSQLLPVSAECSLLRWQLYELPSLLEQPKAVRAKVKQDAVVFAEKVLQEDKSIVELCQKGLASEGGEPQWQKTEKQIYEFHQMCLRHLSKNTSGSV